MEASSALLPCNGSPGICNLPVSSAVFPAVHNAMSSKADGFQAYNNLFSLEDALENGIRAFQIDACDCGSLGLQMCHTECFFLGFIPIGHRSPELLFTNVKAFLDDNPREVIVIDLQVNDNTLDDLYNVLEGIPGFVDMMYDHPRRRDPWPLMSELIDSNKRIIFFQHNGPTCRNNECPPGIHYVFDHMFDTPYDLDEDGLLDYETSCVKNRGSLDSAFMMSNHYAKKGFLASVGIAQNVNLLAVIESRHEYCQEKLGREVNIVMVDYWSIGGVVAYAQEENAIRAGLIEAVSAQPTSSPTVSQSPGPSEGASSSVSDIPSSMPSQRPSKMGSTPPSETDASGPSEEMQGRSQPAVTALKSGEASMTSGGRVPNLSMCRVVTAGAVLVASLSIIGVY